MQQDIISEQTARLIQLQKTSEFLSTNKRTLEETISRYQTEIKEMQRKQDETMAEQVALVANYNEITELRLNFRQQKKQLKKKHDSPSKKKSSKDTTLHIIDKLKDDYHEYTFTNQKIIAQLREQEQKMRITLQEQREDLNQLITEHINLTSEILKLYNECYLAITQSQCSLRSLEKGIVVPVKERNYEPKHEQMLKQLQSDLQSTQQQLDKYIEMTNHLKWHFEESGDETSINLSKMQDWKNFIEREAKKLTELAIFIGIKKTYWHEIVLYFNNLYDSFLRYMSSRVIKYTTSSFSISDEPLETKRAALCSKYGLFNTKCDGSAQLQSESSLSKNT